MVRVIPALLLCGLIILQTACQKRPGETPTKELLVFAAASLARAFPVLGERFEAAHPGNKIQFSFAGSQTLAQQIAHGAPADVFASANQLALQAAVEAGRINPSDVRVFATNQLVIVYPAGNPANLQTLHDLAGPGIKLVLAAPQVPAGAYSLEFLDKASREPGYGGDYEKKVLANVVSYEDNINSVISKVTLGEADAGIVYRSDFSSGDQNRLGMIEIPEPLNVRAEYPLALVLGSPQPDLAEDFIDYVLSPEGQALLADYGFNPMH